MVERGSGIGEDQEEESGLGKSFHSDCPAARDPDAPSSIGIPIARASCTMLLMLALCCVILCVSRSLALRFSREARLLWISVGIVKGVDDVDLSILIVFVP